MGERKRKIMEKKRAAAKADISKYGPRDIEKPKNWKGSKYDESEQEALRQQKHAEMERKKKEAAAADLIKSGPRDMGKIKYHGTKYDEEEAERLRARKKAQEDAKKKEAVKKELQKQKALEQEKKLKSEFDPRNISKPKDWKGLKYDESEQRRKRMERKRKIMEKKRAAAKA